MSRISKDLAWDLARKLTSGSESAIELLRAEFEEAVTCAYEAQIPDDIKELSKRHPDWFQHVEDIRLDSSGFASTYVNLTRPVIAFHGKGQFPGLNNSISAPLVKMNHKIMNADKKYKTLKRETQQALLALKTHANIIKHFPNAAPLLPRQMSLSLVVNFDSLKRRLNQQPEIPEAVTTK